MKKIVLILLALSVTPTLAGTIYEWKDPATGKLQAGDKPPAGIEYWVEGHKPAPKPVEVTPPVSTLPRTPIPASPPSNEESVMMIIRLNGYRCDTVDSIRPFLLSYGLTVHCNQFRYKYEIEDRGGRMVVTVK